MGGTSRGRSGRVVGESEPLLGEGVAFGILRPGRANASSSSEDPAKDRSFGTASRTGARYLGALRRHRRAASDEGGGPSCRPQERMGSSKNRATIRWTRPSRGSDGFGKPSGVKLLTVATLFRQPYTYGRVSGSTRLYRCAPGRARVRRGVRLGGWKRSASADPAGGAREWPTDRRSSRAECTFTSNTSSPSWPRTIEGQA